MAFTKDQLSAMINRIDEGDLKPSKIREKYKTKDAVSSKYKEIESFLDQNRPDIKDRESFDLWKNVKNRLTNQFETGRKYADSVPNQGMSTNLDDLNKGNAIKVSATDPAARILEKEASQIDPLQFKEAQRSLGTQAPNIMDVQKVDIAGAKSKALENLSSKGIKGKGKIAAIGTILAGIGSAAAGEPVDSKELYRAGAEALNPLPFGIDELGNEMKKLESATATPERIQQDLQRINQQKEQERQAREEAARPGALEFGKKFQELQKRLAKP